MIKQTILLLSLAAAPLAHANDDFFYVGGKLGVEYVQAHQPPNISYDSANDNETITGGYLGYQVKFSPAFSAAIEAEYMNRDHMLAYSANEQSLQATMDYNASIGILLKHHYAENVDFNLRFSNVKSEVSVNPTSDQNDISTGDLNGYQMAVGFDLLNQSQMSFRIEYVYSNFGEKAIYPTDLSANNKTEIRSTAIVIGAHYRF